MKHKKPGIFLNFCYILGSKLTERRSSKDHHKRKQSAESKEDRPAKKVERSPSSSKPKPDTAEIRQNIKKSLFVSSV